MLFLFTALPAPGGASAQTGTEELYTRRSYPPFFARGEEICARTTPFPRIPPPRFIGQAVRYPMASFFLRREQGAKRAAVIRR